MNWEHVEGESNGHSPYVILEKAEIYLGYLYKATTYTWNGVIMNCSITFVPDGTIYEDMFRYESGNESEDMFRYEGEK